MKQQAETSGSPMRVIRYPELHRKIGLCRTQIWRLEKEGKFPRSITLGSNSKGWLEHEVDAWLLEHRTTTNA